MPRVNKRTRRSLARGVEFVASVHINIRQDDTFLPVDLYSWRIADPLVCPLFFRAQKKIDRSFRFSRNATSSAKRDHQVHRIFPLNSGGPPRAGLRPSGKPELFHSNHSGHTGSIFLNGRSRARVAYWGHKKKLTNSLNKKRRRT